jgi:threonine dehydratase
MSDPGAPAGVPTPAQLLEARAVVARHHPRTPLHRSARLSQESGCSVHVKHENHGPIRSFKARGALYRVSLLSPDERAAGVVTASTGNHGQGIAYASAREGVASTVVAPEGAPSIKLDAMLLLGATVRVDGADLAESTRIAAELAAAEGMTYVEDGDDGGLMAGAGTIAWEILEDLPRADVLVVPVGGGNLIAGVALVAKRLRPDLRIVGVQSSAAQSVYLSFREGRVVEAACETFAGGLATSYPGRLAFSVVRDLVDEIRLVEEDELRRGIARVLATTGQVAEGAGAAAFAALDRYGSEWRGANVVLILTGGNTPVGELRETLAAYDVR